MCETVVRETYASKRIGFSSNSRNACINCAASAPSLAVADQAIRQAGDFRPDTILGLGGGSLLVDNALTDNATTVGAGASDGYARNVFRGNAGTGPQVSGGVPIGPNLCQTNTTCP